MSVMQPNAPKTKKTKYDFIAQNKDYLENSYVTKYAYFEPIAAKRNQSNWHSFFNHKDIAKEFTEAYGCYRHLKKLLKELHLLHHDRLVFFDVCCGKGFISVLLANKFPNAKIIMIDNVFYFLILKLRRQKLKRIIFLNLGMSLSIVLISLSHQWKNLQNLLPIL